MAALPLLIGSLLAGASCAEEPPPPAPPPAEVAFVTVQPESVTLTEELPGRVSPFRTAEVRARVSGIVLRREFTGGETVEAGDVLFLIDPAPLQAAVARAEAAVTRAESAAALAESEANRHRPLVEHGAISQSLWESVIAEERQTEAQVAEARAALRQARLDLGYARVTAPIDGVVGLPLVTEGALVGEGDATPMARIQQIDQVYVDIKQPASALNEMRAAGLAEDQMVEITSGDPGAPVLQGQLLFSDITVNPSTGEVTLRALVPNPEHLLLPGQYVRAQLSEAVRERVLLVPQQAVTRDPTGRAQVSVLTGEGGAEARAVELGEQVGDSYIVAEGLERGDRVIVEGQDKIRPGAPIRAKPWRGGARPAVASAEEGLSRD